MSCQESDRCMGTSLVARSFLVQSFVFKGDQTICAENLGMPSALSNVYDVLITLYMYLFRCAF